MSDSQYLTAQLVLPVHDITQACDWYAHSLGFETVFVNRDDDDPEGNYAILRRDSAVLHLIRDEPPRAHAWQTAGTGYLFLVVRGVQQVYQQVQSRGVQLTREMQTEAWGVPAFQLTDPSGNLILVAEAVTSES